MKINYLYIVIFVLIGIIFLQRQCTPVPSIENKSKIDTVIIEKIIRDTIPGKPVYLKGKIDTVWMDSSKYKPHPEYSGLLNQYTQLGNNHFKVNTFKTDFKIDKYGTVSVYDTIKGNQLIGSNITYNLKIPETIINKEVPTKAKNQLYAGFELAGNSTYPIKGGYAGLILKTKKDKIYGLSLGYQDKLILKGSMYWKIKIK